MEKTYVSNEEERLSYVEKLYNEIVSSGDDFERMRVAVDKLVHMQRDDGSWAVIQDWKKCELEERVYCAYYPTYYATAALMYADLKGIIALESDVWHSFNKGLTIALGRKLRGHGYDAVSQMIEVLGIYKKAGLYQWIRKIDNEKHDFSMMINDIMLEISKNYESGRTVFGWGVDMKKAFEKELTDYMMDKSGYVWYACYGSNINSKRFGEYINRCKDKTYPKEDRPFTFNHNMYFAKTSIKWNHGAKAFIDSTSTGHAYGRIYLITAEQFCEIHQKEGADYGKCMFLDVIDGKPVFTFTDKQKNQPRLPSHSYFKTIYDGLVECYGETIANKSLGLYLNNCVMEENVFEVLKTIRTSEHSVTIDDIVLSTQINESYVCSAIEWLMEMGVLQKDKSCVEEDRYFTTNNTEVRQLIDEMINVVA